MEFASYFVNSSWVMRTTLYLTILFYPNWQWCTQWGKKHKIVPFWFQNGHFFAVAFSQRIFHFFKLGSIFFFHCGLKNNSFLCKKCHCVHILHICRDRIWGSLWDLTFFITCNQTSSISWKRVQQFASYFNDSKKAPPNDIFLTQRKSAANAELNNKPRNSRNRVPIIFAGMSRSFAHRSRLCEFEIMAEKVVNVTHSHSLVTSHTFAKA
jgi:hypothetical protein